MLIPVILAGGSGTRLWPLSRKSHPKQFLRLTGDRSLLENTVLRITAAEDVGPVWAVGGQDHRFVLAEHLRRSGQEQARIILEPLGRNTAPAAAVAALAIAKEYADDAVMMLCPADHVVDKPAALHQAMSVARRAADHGDLVTFGINPSRAETGYGYIKAGGVLASGAQCLEQFVEKPDTATAQSYLDSGDYYWNAGMFVFQAGRYLEELEQQAPEILRAARHAFEKASLDGPFLRLDADSFAACPSDSIDYAVMEKTEHAAVVPLDCGWDDVGSWAFLQRDQADANGNRVQGDVWLEQARNTHVRAESRMVAVIGTDDLVVVETKDAVLVSAANQTQKVKAIVDKLTQAGRNEIEVHPKMYRPWGSYESVDCDERHQVKRIIVKPGAKLSLQMHHHRAEHWIVVKGTAKVTCGDKTFLLSEDQSTYIPVGTQHRLENPGSIELELIEVQTGSYLGEDDIVRFDDDYGR